MLFELLSRWADSDFEDIASQKPVHPSEASIFQGLVCQLERQLIAPFEPNYTDLVQAARKRLAPETL